MDKCWANGLGDCSDKLSREHLITESMFLGDSIKILGLPWCKNKAVEIGSGSATAKILCKKHNSDLSAIDETGKLAFDMCRSSANLAGVRRKLKPLRWTIKHFITDGPRLERWCLKTLINLCCNGPFAIGFDSKVQGKPSDRLVRTAFGFERFSKRAGLYVVSQVGTTSLMQEMVVVMPLISDADTVQAGMFSFYGIMLMIYLE